MCSYIYIGYGYLFLIYDLILVRKCDDDVSRLLVLLDEQPNLAYQLRLFLVLHVHLGLEMRTHVLQLRVLVLYHLLQLVIVGDEGLQLLVEVL